MKKLSPEEKEKLQQKIREHHKSIRVARLELGSGLKLRRVILGFLSTLAVGVILIVYFLALDNYREWPLVWLEAWEGRVVEKYTYKEVFLRTYAVKLTTGRRKDLPYSFWNRVKVGDYIVKKGHSYIIEIRQES